VGRFAWLFADTPAGADASAIHYSLIETAKTHGLVPCAYLNAVFKALPYAYTVKKLKFCYRGISKNQNPTGCLRTFNKHLLSGSKGEVRTAQLFVAVMGATNYTFAEATYSQSLPDWLSSHARSFDFLGACRKWWCRIT
jgi:hypothetical protein